MRTRRTYESRQGSDLTPAQIRFGQDMRDVITISFYFVLFLLFLAVGFSILAMIALFNYYSS